MKKRLTSVVVAGALTLGGLGAGLVALPVLASAATVDATEEGTVAEAVGDRLSKIRDALDGLVSDGTIDEAQADAVAETLDEALPQRGSGGPGGHAGHGGHEGRGVGLALDEAAGLLGITADELLVELREGQSLTAVAEAQGVEVDTLVDGLVTAAEERIAERVADGDITQEEADERLTEVEERVTALVEQEDLPLRGGHRSGGENRGADARDGTTAESTGLAT
ncbi:MAG: hypothetical protein ACFCVF_04145 [Kineosporiaceae bacterium]